MKPILLFVSFFLLCIYTNAQISLKTEYMGTSSYRDDDTNEKIGDSKGSAIVYQGNINIPLSMKMNERNQPTAWSINTGASYVSLKNKNFTEDLVSDEIMNGYLGITHMRPISNKWSLILSLGAGVYSPTTNVSKITSKHILGNGCAIFVCNVRPNLQLGGGLAVNNSFGYPMAFPAMYLNWNTDGLFQVNISMADGLNMSAGYNLNKYMCTSLIFEMNGQMSLLEKDGKDMMFTHQYMIGGGRLNFKIADKISIPLTVGVNCMRIGMYKKRTLKAMFSDQPGGYFQASPYIAAGIAINFK
ncbi:MAG: DUF6268 family outer membrane beta-barrel protein [Dysgonomonas sp.]|nr:DUF6268 family outer membrane beta-barrel protein [Dysgonomonas sp.]